MIADSSHMLQRATLHSKHHTGSAFGTRLQGPTQAAAQPHNQWSSFTRHHSQAMLPNEASPTAPSCPSAAQRTVSATDTALEPSDHSCPSSCRLLLDHGEAEALGRVLAEAR